ncbi:LacI family transcriptional regulator [Aliiruegeria haliotis]|uniref:LacI family transcriptional regulator n=1 Tax=Aliiruegeria haliotis TaxID=1280846 RepID=A0A2T0RIN5_9RHOB|nr:LacI family DNA-binding transcriptional regulator [Aliiruegeria haliotis]PRY20982.1 LacI family transcriptional regulator [Aliiruegeria haliotis]
MGSKKRDSSRVTLSDVARLAKVSAITVSRCIRNPERVSEDTRVRILRAIDDLGYVPDMAASALASKRSNVVGLVIPSLTNSVFTDVLKGVYDAIEETRLTVQIGNSRYSPSKEENLIRTFLQQRPAGLIVAGVNHTEAGRKMLEASSCPVVQIMDVTDKPVDRLVGFSHFEGAKAAVRHLHDMGYRRPGILTARMDPRSRVRLAGFTEEAQQLGIFEPARVVSTPLHSSVGLGAQLFSDLLAQAPDTDSLFCNNDDLATGALFEAARRNIRVPEALGVCGYNDLDISAEVNPSLTTIATPRYEVGLQSVQMINAALDPEGEAAPPPVILGTKLVPRQSTRRRPMPSVGIHSGETT